MARASSSWSSPDHIHTPTPAHIHNTNTHNDTICSSPPASQNSFWLMIFFSFYFFLFVFIFLAGGKGFLWFFVAFKCKLCRATWASSSILSYCLCSCRELPLQCWHKTKRKTKQTIWKQIEKPNCINDSARFNVDDHDDDDEQATLTMSMRCTNLCSQF